MGKLRYLNLSIAATLMVALGACTSTPEDPIEREVFLEANDPLEPMNRTIFAFNTEVDRSILEPTAIAYRKVVPQPGRAAIGRFLQNLRMPLTFVNDLLQLEFGRSADTLARFLVNSSVGLLGFLEIVDTPAHEEDFGQTLGHWGMSEGFYLVLPFLGPSSLRDGLGLVADSFINPWQSVLDPTQTRAFAAEQLVATAVSDRERIIDEFNDMQRTSLDIYATVRSLYRQNRVNQIRNGSPPPDPVFEFD